ncbi:undecaprenyldiphospho-muramoylpentapeptide beta-N-acetylglucosaminyltransferase [Haloimpatiens sp. FM7315]|uniref:undecaprenyldiphospho-muramoylpentapeptide beta-N-acetylglucosaminyltransferase n=1 Tax=Haloimpatiens sp. FM7315 TaxID=3298609 RepID=UPI0035A297B0
MKIIMTGGGSAGHVTPNLALVPKLKELGYEIEYIGSENGIERSIIEKEGIKYYPISTGKLRRYVNIKNLSDPFKVLKGIYDAAKIIKREKPNVIFSKGGFVSVPVVIGAYFNKIPVVAHESDMTPGLANKISLPYCTKICVTFPETLKHIKNGKGVLSGTPIRKELFEGSKIKALRICEFEGEKEILLAIGGSLGSKFINDLIRNNLDKLLYKYDILHVCGKNNLDDSLVNRKGYKQYEYVSEELKHFINASDIVVSRAGANVIFELLALNKPNILIPLSAKVSRGDQILNANSFKERNFSIVLEEEKTNNEIFMDSLRKLDSEKSKYIKTMKESGFKNGADIIVDTINKCSKR